MIHPTPNHLLSRHLSAAKVRILPTLILAFALTTLGCQSDQHLDPAVTAEWRAGDPDDKLYTLEPKALDTFLQHLHASTPDLRERILAVAHRQLGQPYDIYLLGEFPFEVDDPQPLYNLEESDCVVFVEHTYAMALGDDWAQFFGYLQRIRYIDGRIGVATRNHYTEPQWNPNNAWLVKDITESIAGDAAVPYKAKANVAKFLRDKFGTQLDDWIIEGQTTYLPFENLDRARGQLQDGDVVQIVRGTPPPPATGDSADLGVNGRFAGAYVGHFGLVEVDDAGELWMIHSASPHVRRERIADYGARSAAGNAKKAEAGKPQFLGFKFLALQENALDNLKQIDGEHAPVVTYAPNMPLPRE